ncbi:scarecrow-like protein 6 [Cucumis melo var. makuwa]|uniref:Scarecrow-like protein 6 n=1 Tax=Cucumis melo var. makuwa TaxID=1194695 RepID=A0A5D3CSI2_CUCMM|nr:scarecrow-like protein 6 [Cucumis melo var. makuwa]UPT51071.1 GRAS protein [Cucumis melo]
MKAMPLPFPFDELRPNGVLNFTSVSDSSPSQPPTSTTLLRRHNHWSCTDNTNLLKEICYVGAAEPTSVLDTRRSPSPPTSTSTLSSSLGGGGGGGGGTASTDTTVAAPPSSLPENPSPLDKCGGGGSLGIDDWESVLPESPSQGPSILGLIMGDVEDPSLGLNKLLQSGGGGGSGGGDSHLDLEFSAGFSAVDHGLVFEPNSLAGESIVDPSLQGSSCSDFPNARLAAAVSNSNAIFSGMFQNQNQMVEGVDEKPQIFSSSQVVMNQNQTQFTQNPALFMPLPYASPVQDHHQNHHHHHLLGGAPPAKRFNSGSIGPNYPVKSPFLDSGQENFSRRQQQQQPHQVQLFPHHSHHHNVPQQQQRPSMAALAKQKMVNEDIANQQLQQGISDQLFKAVELIETGNSVLAQGILARLNHQLSSPIGKPFQRAAFYFKEALQLLLQNPSNHPSSNPNPSPFTIIFKIAAYKSFSEVSPVLQFANFTSNQALLEAFNGFDRIHIIDFDIGYGGQWASLMQELALRSNTTGGGPPFLRITAFASTSTHDNFELGFTQENLKNFANDLNIGFELEVVNVECLNSGSWPLPLNVSENEAIAVNLPVGSFFNYSLSLPMILRFVKHLNPKIVVSVDRGCSRMDAPFPHRVINALHSYSALLESMEAVTVNMDTQLKIERYLVQPCIEKVVTNPQSSNERAAPWKSVFLSSGFCPLTFSNFTESQAECLLQRTPVQGFHIDKRHSSLVLCWHRKELVSISAWRS